MVKFFKRNIAVFLSCSMLFCSVSRCFGVDDDKKPGDSTDDPPKNAAIEDVIHINTLDVANKAAQKAVSDFIAKKATKEVIEKAVSEAVEKAASRAAEEAASRAAEEAASKAVVEAASKAVEDVVRKVVDEDIQRVVEEIASKAVEEAIGDAIEKAKAAKGGMVDLSEIQESVKEAVCKSVKETACEAVEGAADKAVVEAASKAAKEAVLRGAEKEVARKTLEKIREADQKEAANEELEEAACEAVERAVREIAEEAAREAVQEGECEAVEEVERGGGKKIQLLPSKKADKNQDRVQDAQQRSYISRRIQVADVSKALYEGNCSQIVVATTDFFLYPPRNVKELFEARDKEAIFAYKDAMLHTDIARSTEAGECCCKDGDGKCCNCCNTCCNSCCKCPECLWGTGNVIVCSIIALVSGAVLVGAIINWENARNMDKNDPARKSLLVWFGAFIGISAIALTVSGFMLYNLISKVCCGCYIWKPSHYGCSCCTGCREDNGSICCVNQFNCTSEKNCCLKCCPYDNGGCACDWFGCYGTGGCCVGPVYSRFAEEGGSVKKPEEFESFFKDLVISKNAAHLKEGSILDDYKWFLLTAGIIFKRKGHTCVMGVPERGDFGNDFGMGRSVIETSMVPEIVGHILNLFCSNNVAEPEDPAWKDFKRKERLPNEKRIKTILDLVKAIAPREENLDDQFITTIRRLCNYALQGEKFTEIEQVRLENYFNFIKALWKIQKNQVEK